MKKVLILLLSILTGIYLSQAINLNLSSGNKLDISNWQEINNVINKINLSSNNLSVNGKLISSGKICSGDICIGAYGTKLNPGLSCKDILDFGGSVGDGLYYIAPNGGATSDAFQVYCDMTTDGGGWTLIARAILNSYAHVTENAVGTLTSSTQTTVGKLSDTKINEISPESDAVLRITPDGAKFFVLKSLIGGTGDFKFDDSRMDRHNDSSSYDLSGTRNYDLHDNNMCTSSCGKYRIVGPISSPAYYYIDSASETNPGMRNNGSVNGTSWVR